MKRSSGSQTGWADLAGAGVYDVTLFSTQEIVDGDFDDLFEDIIDMAKEEGFEAYPLGVVLEEDTGLITLVKNDQAYTAEAHLGQPDDTEPFFDLLSRYVGDDE